MKHLITKPHAESATFPETNFYQELERRVARVSMQPSLDILAYRERLKTGEEIEVAGVKFQIVYNG